jgi:CubicO group peptidase (beta-lactamase class C family)
MSFKKIRQKSPNTVLLIAIYLILISSITQGESKQNTYNDYLLHAESELGFSGSVLVTKDNSILVSEGYGLANRKTSNSNSADTKFLLCSVSKPLTATAIMQLVERGSLALDDPITKYVSGNAGSSAGNITVYNLLTQTSGIPEYLSLVDSDESFSQPIPTDQVVSMIMNAAFEFEPGLKWQYSNSNYYLLGRIIEAVSGLNYGEYMDKNIFTPLEMNNSGFPNQYLNDLPESAIGYNSDTGGNLVAASAVHSSWPFAAGGLYSTAADMVKWDRALRNESLLTAESITKMFTPFKWRYGCGWEIDTLYGFTVASHGGTGGGYCSIIVRFVDYPVCVVVLSNNEDAFRYVSKVAYDLVAITFGVPLEMEIMDEPVAVDPKILEEYAGDYELAPGVAISFINRDGRLFTQGPGQPEMEVFPRSETEFFLKVVEGSVQFVRDSAGTVSGILIRQGGRDISANKIR